MRYILIFLMLALALVHSAPGASLDASSVPRFVSVGDTEQVPDGIVSALAESRDGFIWIGTARGVVRYDGYRFRLFDNGWSSSGKHSSVFVRSLLATRDGRLFVGADFAGLLQYDPATDALQPVPLAAPTLAVEPLSINAIAEDADGNLWIATDGQGLLRRSSNGAVSHYNSRDRSGLPDDRIFSLASDERGNLWVGSGHGLVRRARNEGNFERVTDDAALRDSVVTALSFTDGTTLNIGTRSGKLRRVNIATNASEAMPDVIDVAAPKRGSIYAIARSKNNELWIAHGNGIEIRSADDARILLRLRHDASQQASLAGNEVRDLLESRDGLMWIGGYGGGLQRHDPSSRAFRNLGREVAFDSPLRDVSVRSIAALSDGSVVLGTQDEGVLRLDSALANAGILHDGAGNPLLRGQRITALAQSTDGALWIGSDVGLTRYDLQSREGVLYPLGPNLPRRLLADPSGDLWLATQDGLFRISGATRTPTRVASFSGAELYGDINALALARDGSLWIGGDRGLARLAPNEEKARWIELTRNDESMLPDVLGLYIDAGDQVWFDTPAGLFRLELGDATHGRAIALDTSLNSPEQPFGANLLSDAQGRIWSMRHLYDPASRQIVKLGVDDGIDSGSSWFRAYARKQDGRLLFGGSKGVLVVQPEAYIVADIDPPLVITELKINGAQEPIPEPNQVITLSEEARSISVEYAALDFRAPERVHYRHRLRNYDPDWIESDARGRFASYANLPPGDYQLDLEGSNRSGRWSRHTLVIPLQVLPAWWQTWWARAGALALLLLLLSGFVRLRTSMLRTRKRALESMIRERTRALEAMSAELRAKSEALEHASITDPLTGLRNRRYVDAQLQADVARSIHRHDEHRASGTTAPPEDADLVFFLVDIDLFKQVNDEHGHAAGDAVLIAMGERLMRSFRDADHVVRWGGEEFLIIARQSTRQRAAELAERVCAAVASQAFDLPGGSRQILTCSIGFAAFPLQPSHPRAADWPDVVALADFALYAVKRGGRNGWAGLEVTTADVLTTNEVRAPLSLLDKQQIAIQSSIDATTLDRVWRKLTSQGASATATHHSA